MLGPSPTHRSLLTLLLLAGFSSLFCEPLHAGCHFWPGSSHAATQIHSRDHARNFHFLGQWIYERGEMKYAAWSDDQPGESPNCHSDAPSVPPKFLATNSNPRTITPVYLLARSREFEKPSPCDCVAISSDIAISLYRPVPLKPPR